MSASYYLRLLNASGVPVLRSAIKDFSELEVGLKENDRGQFKVVLSTELLEDLRPARDWRVEVWRSVDSRPPRLVGSTVWFIRNPPRTIKGGQRTTRLEGHNANGLLARRWIAYPEKTPQTEKEGPADDVMKAFVRENLGALVADSARNWSAYITIAADESLAPVVRVEAARKNLLSVLQNIAEMSAEAGTYLAFDITYDPHPTTGGLFFQTYVNQRGVDRSQSSGNPLILSYEGSQLDEVEIDENWTGELSFNYEVGKGSGPARPVKTAQDAALIAASPFGRIEGIHSSGNISNPVALQDAANATLRAAKAVMRFKARYVDTPGKRFGVDFDWGDLVVAQADGDTFDSRVNAVGLKVAGKAEDIDLRLESL